jgi:sporulation protein YlmC with PRC-barrel domain
MATSVDTRETTSLISSDKVDGTAVYGSDGEKIGSIEHLMIDKISGKVAYAVLTFGGFMGFGEDFYPIPWSTLEYDTNLGGYRLDVTKEQLKTAPKYTESTGWKWNRQSDETVHSYYMAPPYWSQLT